MFPLESVLLPGSLLPLHVVEERYRVMTQECLAGDRTFGVVLIERGREVGGGDERVDVGTAAIIEEVAELVDGRFALICRGTARLHVVAWLPDDPYPVAEVEIAGDEGPVDPSELARAEASVRRAWALLSELGVDSPLDPGLAVGALTAELSDSATEAWAWCALAPLTALDRCRLLEAAGHAERLELLCDLTDGVAADARGLLSGGQTGD